MDIYCPRCSHFTKINCFDKIYPGLEFNHRCKYCGLECILSVEYKDIKDIETKEESLES